MRDTVIAGLVVAVGVLGYFTISQRRQIRDLSSKASASSLALQGSCAKQAAIAYKDSGWAEDSMAGYQDHYNQKLDKCFVMMANTKDVGGKLRHIRQLMDAFEGRELGYFWTDVADPAGVIDCRVTLPSGEEQHCRGQEEFDHLVNVYMR